jgi:hypothetical protein
MKNLGSNILFLAFLLLIVYQDHSIGRPFNYYLVAYANDNWRTNVLFAKVDLENKAITFSENIDLVGELQFSNPIPLIHVNDTVFFISTLDGLSAKNSKQSSQMVSKYALANLRGNSVVYDQIRGVQLLDYKLNNGGMTEINYIDNNGKSLWGNLLLDSSRHLEIQFTRNENYDTINYPRILKFRGFCKLSSTNNNLYWDATPDGEYIIKMNVSIRSVQDTCRLTDDGHYNCLVGLAPGDSIIYVLNVYNHISAEPESLARITSDQGYTKLLRASNFAVMDSIPIEDPPVEAGYIGGGMGPCDRVGPYLVYYFSNSQDYRQFFPAMLFIFDTRNNQASWLRVGWR